SRRSWNYWITRTGLHRNEGDQLFYFASLAINEIVATDFGNGLLRSKLERKTVLVKPKTTNHVCFSLSRHSRGSGKDRNHILWTIQFETVFSDSQILSLLEIFIELRIDSWFLTESADPGTS